MRDHGSDFNKSELESVPASWVLRVNGRVLLKDNEEEEEVHEDAVCMCCFDGTSVEGNRIMFCDGCNAALHQACYGVFEIPEGHFYCDRCVAIQSMADEEKQRKERKREEKEEKERKREERLERGERDGGEIEGNYDSNDDSFDRNEVVFDIDNAKDAVRCCLCHVYHGGLKVRVF
jgi:hypothetical protein